MCKLSKYPSIKPQVTTVPLLVFIVRVMFIYPLLLLYPLFFMCLISHLIFYRLIELPRVLTVLWFSYPNQCLLQDLTTKKIFGRGYEYDGLYYFGEPPPFVSSSLQASALPTSSSSVFSFKTLKIVARSCWTCKF